MLEFMHSRWLYLVAALVIAAVVAAYLLDPEPAPVPVVATPVATEIADAGSAVAEGESDAKVSGPSTINLALVIDSDSSKFLAIPEDPETLLRELTAAVEAGAPDAADALFLFAVRCSSDATIPMPSTEATYAEARERLLQTRTLTTPGPIVTDLDVALRGLEKGYRLCSAFERLDLPGHRHWNRVAAELGSYYAMVLFWDVQRGTGDWEAVQARSIEYLERARDDGYVSAFLNIGLMYGGVIHGGPYTANQTKALAHLYATLDLRTAIISERDESGYYADEPSLRRVDTSKEEMSAKFVRRLEMQVSPHQMDAARERADELLDRCCR